MQAGTLANGFHSDSFILCAKTIRFVFSPAVLDSLEPLKGKFAVKVAANVTIAVAFHGVERTPSPAGQRAVVWAGLDRLVPPTGRGSATLRDWRLTGALGNWASQGSRTGNRRRHSTCGEVEDVVGVLTPRCWRSSAGFP